MLNVFSIFESIDGEVNSFGQGACTIFIRLAGCNLRCTYGGSGCDTKMAQLSQSGTKMENADVIQKVFEYKSNKVTITGGEPLLQMGELSLVLDTLRAQNYKITLETNGTINPQPIIHLVDSLIMDCKIGHELNSEYFRCLLNRTCDWIKFVVWDMNSFLKACTHKEYLEKYCCPDSRFAFSPVTSQLSPKKLLEWIFKYVDNLSNTSLNVQLHKLIDLKEDQI